MGQEPRRRCDLRHLLVAAMAGVLLTAADPAAPVAAQQYLIPTQGSEPLDITEGPDGALWFTESSGNKIGRVTTSGTFTEFLVPTTSSDPSGITAGPDGALWFTESSGNKIGRVTTGGNISEFPIPTAASQPSAITAGPDGALWFVEGNGNNIGRITTGGSISEFAIPTAGSVPLGITGGADGALWFTEQVGNNIGRITTGGNISEYPAPAPERITSGADGALWFTEIGTNLGRIATNGAITEYALTSEFNKGIIGGPDGALWVVGCPGIQRVSTAGIVTSTGGSSELCGSMASTYDTAITVGPNGTLWYLANVGVFVTPNYVTAVPAFQVLVSEIGTGAGKIVSSPQGINCVLNNNLCSAAFFEITPITLTASATAGSIFEGWSGGGCSGKGTCNATLTADITETATFKKKPTTKMLSVALSGGGSGTVTSSPSGINCGPTCSASFDTGRQITLSVAAASGSTFAGWSGVGCSGIDPCTVTLTVNSTVTANFVQNTSTNIALAAAVLPLSRSVEVGATATAFATLIDAGPGDASTCSIAPATSVPASFTFQTTDPTTNALTGTANTPVNIAQGASQSFVIAFTPSAAFSPTNVLLTFACANASAAPQTVGIDTLNLSASSSPVPDIVALAASSDPGYVDIPGATGTGDFAVATVNLGSASQITASANTGTASLPVALTVCQTDPTSGICLAAPAANVTTTIAANATPTFGIFVTGGASVPDSPGLNRVFVQFNDANGVLRGETSVAVRTQ
jgi:virginiamycin B lyase